VNFIDCRIHRFLANGTALKSMPPTAKVPYEMAIKLNSELWRSARELVLWVPKLYTGFAAQLNVWGTLLTRTSNKTLQLPDCSLPCSRQYALHAPQLVGQENLCRWRSQKIRMAGHHMKHGLLESLTGWSPRAVNDLPNKTQISYRLVWILSPPLSAWNCSKSHW